MALSVSLPPKLQPSHPPVVDQPPPGTEWVPRGLLYFKCRFFSFPLPGTFGFQGAEAGRAERGERDVHVWPSLPCWDGSSELTEKNPNSCVWHSNPPSIYPRPPELVTHHHLQLLHASSVLELFLSLKPRLGRLPKRGHSSSTGPELGA